jgi:hypothetical protein
MGLTMLDDIAQVMMHAFTPSPVFIAATQEFIHGEHAKVQADNER